MMLVLLVLCSGFFQCTLANRLRVFNTSENQQLTRTEAVTECKKSNMSLVTLYDEFDANFLLTFMNDTAFWIGLYRPPIQSKTGKNEYKTDDQTCEAFVNDTLTNKTCSDKLAFMCYKDNSSYSVSYELIENPTNWCQARQFCRRHYTDLVNTSSPEQSKEVTTKGKGKAFWTGLMHDRWKWEDNSCSTHRNWDDPTHPPERWVSINGHGLTTFTQVDNTTGKETICSKGKVRIIRSSNIGTWEDAFNYCNRNYRRLLWIEDERDQHAVQQWLTYNNSNEFFWIGLRQSRVFGFWIWTSDRMVSYSNWKNDTPPQQPLSSQCGAIDSGTFEWTDKNCLLQLPFLCEEDIYFMNP